MSIPYMISKFPKFPNPQRDQNDSQWHCGCSYPVGYTCTEQCSKLEPILQRSWFIESCIAGPVLSGSLSAWCLSIISWMFHCTCCSILNASEIVMAGCRKWTVCGITVVVSITYTNCPSGFLRATPLCTPPSTDCSVGWRFLTPCKLWKFAGRFITANWP